MKITARTVSPFLFGCAFSVLVISIYKHFPENYITACVVLFGVFLLYTFGAWLEGYFLD